jgi:uncharacterized membrane protein
MNRDEFIIKLQDELQSIPTEERENALKYYREYFDDAGVENEQKVIEELESPEVIARGIKNILGLPEEPVRSPDPDAAAGTVNPQKTEVVQKTENVQKTEYVHKTEYAANKAGQDIPPRGAEQGVPRNDTNAGASGSGPSDGAKAASSDTVKVGRFGIPTWAVVLLAILLVPIIIPAASGIFGTLVGVVFGMIGVAIGFFAATIGILVAGIAAVVWGIASIIAGALFNGLLLLGAGLTLVGVGLLMLVLSLQLAAVWIPQFIRWICRVIRDLFHRTPVQKGEYA